MWVARLFSKIILLRRATPETTFAPPGYVPGVRPSPASDVLEPGPSGSPGAPGSVGQRYSGPWPEGHSSVERRKHIPPWEAPRGGEGQRSY